MASIHETAGGLLAAGVVGKRSMREFGKACRTPMRPLKPKEIRALYRREGGSAIEASRTAGRAIVSVRGDSTIVQLQRQDGLTRATQGRMAGARSG